MKRYIGLDVHAASTTFAVLSESGKRVGAHVVETNGQALVEQLKTIPGKRHVALEEGTQSAWVYEILSPHAEEVIVVKVPESRGQKNDERDAFHLAEQLRTGGLKGSVFKKVGEFQTLRELARTHAMVVQDSVRVQNRIKALFRSRGVVATGEGVYSEKGREQYLEQLPDASRGAAKTLYAQYDAVEAIRKQAEKDLVQESHRHAISRVLETCPGLGPIRVAQTMSIVVSPDRFRTKRQFWSYCGFAIVTRSSSDWVQKKDGGGWERAKVAQTRGLNLNHNHVLKHVFKGAAMTVIAQHASDPLHQDYQRLIGAGTKPNLAKLTIARKLAAIALSMWKSKEKYDPKKHRKQS
jgi:transposase